MKFFRAYIITVILGLLLVFVLFVTAKDEGNTWTNARQRDYNDSWVIVSEEGENLYKELPETFSREGSESITLKKRLPGEIQDGAAVAFYMGHSMIHAYVGDELVYTFDVPANKKTSKTPGATWEFINLSEEDGGKTLMIELSPVYEGDVNIPDMIYGDRAKIVVEVIMDRVGAVLISTLMLCIGGAIILCMLLFRERLHAPDYMYWLGVFAVNASIWSFIQTQLLSLIYGWDLRGNQISFIVFQILILPLISYVKNLCQVEESKIYDGFCIANIVILVLSTVLQFTGIRDYRETIWISYLFWIVSAVWMVWISLRSVIRSNKKNKALILQCAALVVLIAVVAIDMQNYLSAESGDCARFSRIVLLLYLIIQIYIIFEDSVKLIHLGEQFEKVSKEARHDALTKLSNRTAFEKDMAKYPAMLTSGVAMFDLNNLKYFNDVHGHSMGDYYIIVCSEIIQDIFGSHGKVYRIGGDEFCAVVELVNEEKFEELRRAMDDRIEALNGRFFENKMSVASGFANFRSEADKDIHDTVKRADARMYECKAAMKQIR